MRLSQTVEIELAQIMSPESFGLDWEDAGENFSYDAETVAQIENNVQQRVKQ